MNEPSSPTPRNPGLPPPHAALVPFHEDDEGGIDLWQYVQVLLRLRWHILFCVLVSGGVAVMQVRHSVPIYMAAATLRYEPAPSSIVQFKGMDEETQGREEDMLTQVELITSAPVVRGVIDALGQTASEPGAAEAVQRSLISRAVGMAGNLRGTVTRLIIAGGRAGENPRAQSEQVREALRQQAEITALQGRVKAEPRRGTKLIDVRVADTDPYRAARIADEFGAQFIRFLNENQAGSFREAIAWLKKEVEETRGGLVTTEKKLFEYEKDFDQQVMEQKLTLAQDALGELNVQMEEKRREIAMSEATTDKGDTATVRNVLLASDPAYAALNKTLNELQLRRIAMEADHRDTFPELKSLKRKIEGIEQQIEKLGNDLLKDQRGRSRVSALQIDSLRRQIREQEETVQKIRSTMIDFRSLQREKESKEQIFKALLDRAGELDVTSGIKPSNVTIVSRASIPTSPDSPKVLRTLALFLIAGLGAGMGFALLIHRLDRSVKDPMQVEMAFGLPMLGVIPYMDNRGGQSLLTRAGLANRNKRHPVQILTGDKNKPGSIGAEAFRFIRTSLQYSTAGHPPQIILVTSSVPREGKSTVSANLAASFAGRGEKTLLIDADLKAPLVHESFKTYRSPGLSDVLTGQEPLESALRATEIENLTIMTAGRASPSPVELLESDSMARLLDELRDKFTTIIIDSAPIFGMADSLVLSRIVDGTCIVINRGRTHIEVLQKSILSLHRIQARILGAIYNSQRRKPGEMPGYGYGEGYGYGYGAHVQQRGGDEASGSAGDGSRPEPPVDPTGVG